MQTSPENDTGLAILPIAYGQNMTVISSTIDPSTGAPVIRGLSTRSTDLMEMFQVSVIQAFAAAAGCNVSEPRIDNGIDLDIYHELPDQEDALLRVQLKAVSNGWNASRSAISARMTKLRYDKMRVGSKHFPSIVIIMDLPKDMDQWAMTNGQHLELRHGCYWINLEGQPALTANLVTVAAPVANVFDDEKLCQIMARVRAGGRP